MRNMIPLLFSAKRNLLPNSVWAGGGATPTSWTGAGTGTSAVYGLAADGASTAYRDTATLQRPYLALNSSISIGTYSSIAFAVYIDTIFSGSFTIFDLVSWVNSPAGSTLSYRKNGASVASNSPVASGDRIECIVTSAGTAGSSTPRMGVGINANFTGDLVMSRPMANYGQFAAPYRPSF